MTVYHKQIRNSFEKHIGNESLMLKRKLIAEPLVRVIYNKFGELNPYYRFFNDFQTHYVEIPIDFSYIFEVHDPSICINTYVLIRKKELLLRVYSLTDGLNGLCDGVLVNNHIHLNQIYFQDPNIGYQKTWQERIWYYKKPVVTKMILSAFEKNKEFLFQIPIRLSITTSIKDALVLR